MTTKKRKLKARVPSRAAHGSGSEQIRAERERQISGEGWGPEHDDGHRLGELLDAGLSYIHAAINVNHPSNQKPPPEWPWEDGWWKPDADPVRNLVKAGALIAAEIDRLNRERERNDQAERRGEHA